MGAGVLRASLLVVGAVSSHLADLAQKKVLRWRQRLAAAGEQAELVNICVPSFLFVEAVVKSFQLLGVLRVEGLGASLDGTQTEKKSIVFFRPLTRLSTASP